MRKKNKSIKKENFRLASFFVVLFVGLLVLSLFFKFLSVLERGRYDPLYPFFIKIYGKSSIKILEVDNSQKKAVELSLSGYDKNNLQPEKSLGIFEDGYIKSEKDEDVKSLYKTVLTRNNMNTNLTIIDMVKLSFSLRDIDIKKENIDISKNINDLFIQDLLEDPKISTENKKIQIINASGADGIGNKVSKIVTNIGGNVVLVSTDVKGSNSSEILYNDQSYTLKRIMKIFKLKGRFDKSNGFADITIIIGKDFLGKFNY